MFSNFMAKHQTVVQGPLKFWWGWVLYLDNGSLSHKKRTFDHNGPLFSFSIACVAGAETLRVGGDRHEGRGGD